MSEQEIEERRFLRIVRRCAIFGAGGLILLVLVAGVIWHDLDGVTLAVVGAPLLALVGGLVGMFVGGWVAAFCVFWSQRHQTIEWSEESSDTSPLP